MEKKGKLYLIPTPIAETNHTILSEIVIQHIHRINHFIVERARTSRRFIKTTGFSGQMEDKHMIELDKRNPDQLPSNLFDPIFDGKDMGLMSEAGMPGIADPGAMVVKSAHELEIIVVPLIGPSSLFLSLAASGLNGQQFCFHGYLPVKKPALNQKLNQLDRRVQQSGETQLFIETPYRNESLFTSILGQCSPDTRLCIASEITGPGEFIKTLSIKAWKKQAIPMVHKKTAVFLLGK